MHDGAHDPHLTKKKLSFSLQGTSMSYSLITEQAVLSLHSNLHYNAGMDGQGYTQVLCERPFRKELTKNFTFTSGEWQW